MKTTILCRRRREESHSDLRREVRDSLRRLLRGGVAGVVLVFALNAFSADAPLTPVADPKPLLADLQQKMSSLTSVYLEFDQERRLQLFAEPLKSQGVMMIDRPDLIRWETTAPYQSILLGARKSVAQFEQTDGQWKKLKLGFPQMLQRVMEQMTLMHQGKLDALTSDFTVSVATGHVAVVTMVPKDQDVRSMLAALEIHLEPDLSATREVVMREPGGDFTRIIFRREKRGVKFPVGTFDQAKPLAVAAVQAAVNEAK
jgi:outer membrane lipoprotein-sorting protein